MLSFGADDGARTRYLHLGKVALYQMVPSMDVLFSVIVSAKVNPFEVVADENTLVCKAISIHRLYACLLYTSTPAASANLSTGCNAASSKYKGCW